MTQRLGTKAALGWSSTTDGVAQQLHQLAVPLRELRQATKRGVWVAESLDFSTREVVTVGSGVPEFVGTVRYDDSPQGVADLLKAGAAGSTITYYPDMRDPGTNYPCALIEPTADQLLVDLDPQRGNFGNVSTTIRLRPVAAIPPTPIYRGTALLAWYRGGEGLLGATVVRTGAGSYTDKGYGTILSAASNLARTTFKDLDGDGVRETPLLLIEEQRTNSWDNSEDLTSGAWAKTGVTVVANSGTAPDLSNHADFLKEDSSTGVHNVERAPGSLTTNAAQSQSWFAKPNGRTQLQTWTLTKANTVITSTFDLSAVTTTPGAGHTTTIERLAGGWFRCTVSWNAGSGGTTPLCRVYLMSGGNTSYTGDGASGVYLWGMQNEVDKPFTSTYIPALSGGTTRGSDVVTLPFSAKPQAMTVYCRFMDRGTNTILGRPVFTIGNTNSTVAYLLICGSGNGYQGTFFTANGTSTTASTNVAPLSSDVVELLTTLDANGVLTIAQTIAGITTTVSVGAVPLPQAWGNAGLLVGGSNGVTAGFAAYLNLVAMRGLQDLPTMRRIACL